MSFLKHVSNDKVLNGAPYIWVNQPNPAITLPKGSYMVSATVRVIPTLGATIYNIGGMWSDGSAGDSSQAPNFFPIDSISDRAFIGGTFTSETELQMPLTRVTAHAPNTLLFLTPFLNAVGQVTVTTFIYAEKIKE